MANVKVKMLDAGLRALLKSSEIRQCIEEHANRIAREAGNGYEANQFVGAKRAGAEVRAATREAYRDNLENNTLLKAVGHK